jgi:hypothetical protein
MLLLLAQPTTALEYTGFISAEGRQFIEAPKYLDQSNSTGFSGSTELEFYHAWDDSDLEFEFTPFFRWDSEDDERTHADIRELYFLKSTRDWEFKLGLSKVFWGVTESQHLVDIINQTDLVENLDGEDKLGQTMVQATYIHDWGDFSFFVLPGFRERTFPGGNGRLRTPVPVDTDNPLWESSSEESHVDLAVRWKAIIGDFDIGAYYFKGTSRDPIFLPQFGEAGLESFRPFYGQIDQAGVDVQYTKEGWLWKLEGITRSGTGQSHAGAVGGFEYTFYGVFESATDVGALLEYHHDSRGSLATNPFNRDIFAGTRITLNDEQDTNIIAGTFWDSSNDTNSVRIEFERRIGANYKLEIQFQGFAKIAKNDPLFSFRRDSFFQIDFSRYF